MSASSSGLYLALLCDNGARRFRTENDRWTEARTEGPSRVAIPFSGVLSSVFVVREELYGYWAFGIATSHEPWTPCVAVGDLFGGRTNLVCEAEEIRGRCRLVVEYGESGFGINEHINLEPLQAAYLAQIAALPPRFTIHPDFAK